MKGKLKFATPSETLLPRDTMMSNWLDRAPVVHLVVHRAVTRKVVSSRLRPDQHSGSLNN